MDAKTLTALRGSIEKWKAIEEGRGVNRGMHNCPLCALFIDKPKCRGCPVSAKTGRGGCVDTPCEEFEDWSERLDVGWCRPINPARHKKGVRLARAEREFLESLLPDGEQP